MHERVKHAVVARIKSMHSPEIAPFIVLTEQPVRNHFPLRDDVVEEGAALIADIVVLLQGEVQQDPIIGDFVSCIARDGFRCDFNSALDGKASEKRAKYRKYKTGRSFFPLPFGRTNVLSKDIFHFCDIIDAHFPAYFRAGRKLRASISRAIYVGAAHTVNLAIRRLQLSLANRLPLARLPSSSLSAPFAPVPRSRPTERPPSLYTSPFVHFQSRIASILDGSQTDSSELAGLLRSEVALNDDSGFGF